MKSPKQEILFNPETNMDELKMTLLGVIEQYSNEPSHRKIDPIVNFGEPSGGARLYWAHWSDDNRSTHLIGFMFKDGSNELRLPGGDKSVSIDKAVDCFLEQLGSIPSR